MRDVVYFARDPRTGNVKIGTTYTAEVRLANLSYQIKAPVELLASTPGNRMVEAGFHRLFWDLHVGHEWFRSDPRLEAAIIGLREGWFDISKLPAGPSPIHSEAQARRKAKAA